MSRKINNDNTATTMQNHEIMNVEIPTSSPSPKKQHKKKEEAKLTLQGACHALRLLLLLFITLSLRQQPAYHCQRRDAC